MPELELKVTVDEHAIERQITRHVKRQIGAWLRYLRQTVLDLFDLPKGGPLGERAPRSLPGQPPARQTGHLASTLHTYLIGELGGALDITEPYGAFLNDGTPRILPRPFVELSVELFRQAEASGSLDVPEGSLDFSGGIL